MPMAIRPSIFGSARILGANFRSFTSDSSIGDHGTEAIAHICHLRFLPRMVSEFPFLLPRSVTVAQVILDHFVMVRIHARQLVLNQRLTPFTENAGIRILATS